MWILLGLFMKEHFQFPCFGWSLKVCIVFIVLTSTTSLACYGGGGGGKKDEVKKELPSNTTKNTTTHDTNITLTIPNLDEKLVVNLTGIKETVDRNVKTAFGGWEPSEETKKDWKKWYENWQKENEKNGEVPWNKKWDKGAGGDGSGGPGGQDFSHERGPGSGWPDSPGWEEAQLIKLQIIIKKRKINKFSFIIFGIDDEEIEKLTYLGAGNGGTPVPPWAYVPKNVGKPTICYLPPLAGTCNKNIPGQENKTPSPRWGYNPYTDECQQYLWSGCGGTRNKFISKDKCQQHCQLPAPPSCSADSGILDKSSKPKIY